MNIVPFLITSRQFPQDVKLLSIESDRAYVDVANAVNRRTLGMFTSNRMVQTGETWFITNNQQQQGFRQIYTFTAAGNITHGLNFTNISQFTKCQGSFTDGTNYYGVIYGSSTSIAGQISFYITSTDIVVLSGAGAPTISSGIIVLEWIAFT